MLFRLHLKPLYSNTIYLAFPFTASLMETKLVIEDAALHRLLNDIEKRFHDQVISQPYARNNHTILESKFHLIFFLVPPNHSSLLTLILTRVEEDDEVCNHMAHSEPWTLQLKLCGYDKPVPNSCMDIVRYVDDITLRYKLKHMCEQYDEKDKSSIVIETDGDVIRWMKDPTKHKGDSFSITLHAICTPSVFLCLFFKAMQASGMYPVVAEKEKDCFDHLDIPVSSRQVEEVDNPLYIGKEFHFLYNYLY